MKTTLFASVLAFALSALASPVDERGLFNCVSQQDANTFVSNFATVLAHQNSSLGTPQQTANILLADNFVEYSNSVLSLQGLPVCLTSLINAFSSY